MPQGWNKKWDEWVDGPAIVKYSTELAAEAGAGDGGPPGKQRRQLASGGEADPQSEAASPAVEEKPVEVS